MIVATVEGKSHCITPFKFGLYPASRVSGYGPAGLGNSKLLLCSSLAASTQATSESRARF
jgi:hypothetical protein